MRLFMAAHALDALLWIEATGELVWRRRCRLSTGSGRWQRPRSHCAQFADGACGNRVKQAELFVRVGIPPTAVADITLCLCAPQLYLVGLPLRGIQAMGAGFWFVVDGVGRFDRELNHGVGRDDLSAMRLRTPALFDAPDQILSEHGGAIRRLGGDHDVGWRDNAEEQPGLVELGRGLFLHMRAAPAVAAGGALERAIADVG